MERVIVFIDGSNLYFGCKKNKITAPWDIVALSRDLAGPDRKLIRVYYYNARSRQEDSAPDKYRGEEKFYDHLRKLDYCTVRLGRIEGHGSSAHQKGVDVLLVQDLLTLTFCDAMDCAVIITNDGDFACAIEEVKARGKQVEVAFFGKPAFHLRDVCDKYIDMSKECSNHFKKSEEQENG